MLERTSSHRRLVALICSVALLGLLGVAGTAYADPTAPSLSVGGTVSHVEGGGPIVLAPDLTLTGPGGATIDKATVSIQSGFSSSEDRLGVDGQGGFAGTVAGLSWNYDSTTGVLTLSGVAQLSTYEQALRQITYDNLSSTATEGDRSVNFVVGGGLYFEETQHFYEFVFGLSGGLTWSEARVDAEGRSLYGLQGYLVTLTSAEENAFVSGKLQGQGWLGASDAGTNKAWHWVTGPEAGIHFFNQQFSEPRFRCGHGAAAVQPAGDHYSNWAIRNPAVPNSRDNEPNDWSNGCPGSEDYGHFYQDGTWNDLPWSHNVAGYVVEYGGMPDDPSLSLTGQVTVQVGSTDTDGDGVDDDVDNCPDLANGDQADNDGDGLGDVCDPDDDNDGVDDGDDAFPFDPTEWSDNDGDDVGDNADPDDDNDGQSDADEGACGSDPLDAGSTSPDFDGDGVPDCVDPDDDNDGVDDGDDAFPMSNPSETVVVGDADTGVASGGVGGGANMNDVMGACADEAKNHGSFVSCVTRSTNDWRKAGLISKADEKTIDRAAAKSDIGKR